MRQYKYDRKQKKRMRKKGFKDYLNWVQNVYGSNNHQKSRWEYVDGK